MKRKVGRPSKNEDTNKEYYIDKKEFYNELKAFHDDDITTIPETLALMIGKLVEGLSHRPNFCNYTYKDEMKGDALVKCLAAVRGKKFNFDSDSIPFNYFTTIAWNAFINRINKEKKSQEGYEEYRDMVYNNMLAEGQITEHNDSDCKELIF